MVELLRYPEVFIVRPDSVELNPAFRDFDERTARVEEVLQECRANNTFVTLKGWRNEVSTKQFLIAHIYSFYLDSLQLLGLFITFSLFVNSATMCTPC